MFASSIWLLRQRYIVIEFLTKCNIICIFWCSLLLIKFLLSFIRRTSDVTWVCSIHVTSCLFYSFIITIFHLFLLGCSWNNLPSSFFIWLMKCWYLSSMLSVRLFCNMGNLLWNRIECLYCKYWFDFNTLQS